jgi:hypothetical protein
MRWLPLLVCLGLPFLVVAVAVLVHAARALFGPGAPRLRHVWRARWGRGLGVPELARRLGVEEALLREGTPSYRTVPVPKRGRRGGVRVLHVPDAQTKALQRRILRRLLARLRAHPAAHGFEPGRSILTNARVHEGQRLVVKLDVKDFFPSTKAERVEAYFRRVGWDAEAAALLTRWCTHEGALPQGAPTSPRLSNLVNHGLDAALAAVAKRCRARYTRYADDVTFSATWKRTRREGVLARALVRRVRYALVSYGYTPHPGKTRTLRAHQQQRVTGLVVNRKAALPRRTRRWLRAVEHRARTGGAPTLTPPQLAGWRALLRMVRTPEG